MKKACVLIGILFLTTLAYAKQQCAITPDQHLSTQDIEVLKEAKRLVGEVDTKTLTQTIVEIEKTKYPQINLQMRKAMALAYADIVKEHDIEGQKKKEWLYSMINLNMAYLQFGGAQDSSGQAKPLNKLILRKLKEYLPSDVINQPGFRCSLG